MAEDTQSGAGPAERAAQFAAHRRHLLGIGYRMLGSLSEAEDLVQETYLRWHRAGLEQEGAAKAWLTTTMTRLCIDHLRSARVRRESYVGQWLPEPLLVDDGSSVSAQVEKAEAVSMAFLILLQQLSPRERAAFLLHEVFDYGHDEVAAMLDITPANCRQIVKRARDHLHSERPRFDVDENEQARLRDRFMQTCLSGDMEGLLAIFAEDVTIRSDGGGHVKAALNPVQGADKVARFLLGILSKAPPGLAWTPGPVNGEPAVLVQLGGQLFGTISLDVAQGRIQGLAVVVNPDKLPVQGVG